MSLASGTRLGPYDIVGSLGAGGMGEVYRARDSKLNRDVAIKVLPAAVASDPERLARFEREAQTLAALNHPNIAQVFGFADSALVMELVDGEDLSTRIGRGPIPDPRSARDRTTGRRRARRRARRRHRSSRSQAREHQGA